MGYRISTGRNPSPYITRQPIPVMPPKALLTKAATPTASKEPIGQAHLHQRAPFAAMARIPRLGHQRRAGGPGAAHAQPRAEPQNRHPGRGRRERGQPGEAGIDRDARHQRAHPPDPVGDPAERDAADHQPGGEDAADRSGLGPAQREHRDQRRQGQRQQEGVEDVERPRRARQDQRAPAGRRHPPVPGAGCLRHRPAWVRRHGRCHRTRLLVTAPPVAVRPPSTTYCAPVMLLARSEHRNSTRFATSSAVP